MKKILFIAMAGLVSLLAFRPKQITVFMIGDSTMANKKPEKAPETGWGMPFATMFNESVTVVNEAQNGRSTKSFINEGRWQKVLDRLQEGDYVFIEFGHNDEKVDKPAVGTTIDTFKINLTRFVTETRSKKAIPVLLTPVSRRKVDKDGKYQETHGEYPDAVLAVAKELHVAVIDMLGKTRKLHEELGFEGSKKLFLHLAPGENPNYPTGAADNTHFNDYGARKMAELAVEGIKELKLPLGERLK